MRLVGIVSRWIPSASAMVVRHATKIKSTGQGELLRENEFAMEVGVELGGEGLGLLQRPGWLDEDVDFQLAGCGPKVTMPLGVKSKREDRDGFKFLPTRWA